MKKHIKAITAAIIFIIAGVCFYYHFLAPTRILIINALPAHKTDISLNNDSRHIKIDFLAPEEVGTVKGYHAILMYGRGLYLDSIQTALIEKAAVKGALVFTNNMRNFRVVPDFNLTENQADTLLKYFQNPTGENYRNLLRYIRHISTPRRFGAQSYQPPVVLPKDMLYHLEPGVYFKDSDELTKHLKEKGLYNDGGKSVALIAGVSFPVEGNRMHIDTLISRLTNLGYNVYPITSASERRADLIKNVNPSAVIYLPMGRLGNDSFINWLYDNNIPLYMPFPLVSSHEEWLDIYKPMTGGTLNSRIVIPELDGSMTPMCIATQNVIDGGYLAYTPEKERIDTFVELFHRQMSLRDKPNGSKKVAICYFKAPGQDALLASGLEVVPSLYNFLMTLKQNGYDVSGLPENLEEFKHQIMSRGWIAGDYAPAAQQKLMDDGQPVWITKDIYEKWAQEVLVNEKYAEVEKMYGKAPGRFMSRGDSLCFAAITYGNVLLFPQPRPALGGDDAKMIHGAAVPPPHSYLAPYLYMQKAFDANAIIHFGTHGSLEFTPGRSAGLSQADWADVLIGARPHFYLYTTANVGEATIAKRRTRAVIISHLTPPFIESGLNSKYQRLLEHILTALKSDEEVSPQLTQSIRIQANAFGISRNLDIDSTVAHSYTKEELERMYAFAQEVANEKITGAYYTLGEKYSPKDRANTLVAIMADKVAYEAAKRDCIFGKITDRQLQDYTFISRNYLPMARMQIWALANGAAPEDSMMTVVAGTANNLDASPSSELRTLLHALDGGVVYPAPGGDPVRAPNVLPTGRNMYSVNPECTPDEKAWADGVRLADETIEQYRRNHDGAYPQKISYTFWAGEFINSKGTTIAQAMRMLGVEPIVDAQNRVMDIKLTPSQELGRPRIDVFIQVSGQLRDLAATRLSLLTEAIKLASEATDDIYPNYVAQGSRQQEIDLIDNGTSPAQARELSTMRIFGPVNSGYSTGMIGSTERSGTWDSSEELAERYFNNMCAMYGSTDLWGEIDENALKSAITGTDVIIQPRQSNTWGPISLDHVYEFTGSLSLAANKLDGREPDAYMADYRNPDIVRMQGLKESIAIESIATILNPEFIKARMQGDASTAQMFGKIFRNIFGWNAMRQSAIDPELYDRLYDLYVEDCETLGIKDYFKKVNPAAYQELTATMLESARKGFWKASPDQLEKTASSHAGFTAQFGVPCTEFTCANGKLRRFVSENLKPAEKIEYENVIKPHLEDADSDAKQVVLNEKNFSFKTHHIPSAILITIFTAIVILIAVSIYRTKKVN